jgi:predicted GNAT family N-acyltransferase
MCVCGLFKENINILDYITSIGRMVVVKDMEGSGHSERIIGVVAQIQTR